ncbi:MAG: protein kinase [Gemmataceae bacterium]
MSGTPQPPDSGPSFPEETATLPPAPPLPAGSPTETIPAELAEHPRYRVLRVLGRGGMGAVYLAQHVRMDRLVALKTIAGPALASSDAVARFHREVQAVASLVHPNIVVAYDADQAGPVHFLVMEYLEGTNLADEVRQRGPLPVHEACEVIRQAALGLQYAHEQGVVHRDIKPQNLMRTRQGIIKILDFGLARVQREATQGEGLTQSGMIMGTADYIAPEQSRGSPEVDIRADIYSLGCTLYFLLSGTVPFPGGQALDKILRHVMEAPPSLKMHRRDLPAGLIAVVDRMMAKDPAGRYQTPAEVFCALTPFAGASGQQSHCGSQLSRFSARWSVLAGLLLLVGAIGLGLSWWPRGQGESAPVEGEQPRAATAKQPLKPLEGAWFVLNTDGKCWSNQKSHSLVKRIEQQLVEGWNVRRPAFHPSDQWVVLLDEKEYWTSNVNLEVSQRIDKLPMGQPIKCVAFTPWGGYVLLHGKNEAISRDIPPELGQALMRLQVEGAELQSVAISPEGGWVLLHGKTGIDWTNLPNSCASRLQALQEARTEIACVAFPTWGGWFILQRDGTCWSSYPNHPVIEEVARLRKRGEQVDWLAFAPGWSPSGYVLQSTQTQRVEVKYSVEYRLATDQAHLNVFQIKPPDLPSQTIRAMTFQPPAETVTEVEPPHRSFFLLRSRNKKLVKTETSFQAEFHSQILLPRHPGTPERKIELSPEEARRYLQVTPSIDHDEPAFQLYLSQHGLGRQPGEPDLRLAMRVYLLLRQRLRYDSKGAENVASKVCAMEKGDCASLSLVFVAAMRSAGVPARLLQGRWAKSSVPAGPGQEEDWQDHVMAECFVQDVGWVPVDLSSGCEGDAAGDLACFGVSWGQFITLHVDADLVIDSELFGRQRTFNCQNAWYYYKNAEADPEVKETWAVRVLEK